MGRYPVRFSDVIISTGLTAWVWNVLQPFYRNRFNYSCEGLTNVRGQAAWQIRFDEKRDARGGGIRTWRRGDITYNIAIKGRIWISSASYAVLRVETDLRIPSHGSGSPRIISWSTMARQFSARNAQLWLPGAPTCTWSSRQALPPQALLERLSALRRRHHAQNQQAERASGFTR